MVLLRLLHGGLLLLGDGEGVLVGHGDEGLAPGVLQHLQDDLVLVHGEVEDLVTRLQHPLGLGHLGGVLHGVGADVVDLLLGLGHPVHILLEGGELALLGGPEEHQIPEGVPVVAIGVHKGVLKLHPEGRPELLVLLPVVLHELDQLALDLFLDVVGDDLQLPVVLEHLPGDVQGDIGGVHDALDEAEVVGQQVRALLHDHHPGGVELQALLKVGGEVVHGHLAGDVQQGLVLDGPLGGDVDGQQGILPVAELGLVEVVVLLLGDLALGPLPDGDHGVDGLPLLHLLVLGLVVLPSVLGLGLGTAVLHLHADGVADVVGVLLDEVGQGIGGQVLVIVLLVGVGLDGHDDVGAHGLLLTGLDGVTVHPFGLPLPGRVCPVGLGDHRDLVGHHEGRVESHAELTDDVQLRVVGVLGLLLKLEGAALGDGAQVVFHLLLGHADAVVADGEGARLLVGDHHDLEIVPVQAHLVVGEGPVGQLVDGVAGVGDDLPEEDLLVGIDGVDHQVHQPLGLGFELFLFHGMKTPPVSNRVSTLTL